MRYFEVYTDNDAAVAEKDNRNFEKLMLLINGGLTAAALSPAFSIDVDKVDGALAMDGSRPITGNIECADGVEIDGVDLSEFKKTNDTYYKSLRQEEIVEANVAIDMLEGHLSQSGVVGSAVNRYTMEFPVPNGYDGQNCFIIVSIDGFTMGFSVNTLQAQGAINATKVTRNEGSVSVEVVTKIDYTPANNKVNGMPVVAACSVKGYARFWKIGLDV